MADMETETSLANTMVGVVGGVVSVEVVEAVIRSLDSFVVART